MISNQADRLCDVAIRLICDCTTPSFLWLFSDKILLVVGNVQVPLNELPKKDKFYELWKPSQIM